MKILLVHADKTPWATQRRAEALKREWKDDEVDIVDRWNLPDGEKYDVIHFLFSGGVTKCKEYILKNKDRVFTTLASYRTLSGKWDRFGELMEIYRNTKGCVCQNRDLREKAFIHTEMFAKSVVIPNGVDTDMFNRGFTVGYVGAKDSDEHKGYQMVEKVCEELGLFMRVANYWPHNEMPEFYKSIDCLVLMSESEGCNNPTLEALAMNKPVISTDTGIASELEGVTIVERDVESLKKALRKASGRVQILEQYTWPIIAKKYRELYVRTRSS